MRRPFYFSLEKVFSVFGYHLPRFVRENSFLQKYCNRTIIRELRLTFTTKLADLCRTRYSFLAFGVKTQRHVNPPTAEVKLINWETLASGL
jgi:hypothetical protein